MTVQSVNDSFDSMKYRRLRQCKVILVHTNFHYHLTLLTYNIGILVSTSNIKICDAIFNAKLALFKRKLVP